MKTLEDRFWSKVAKGGAEEDCWVWTAALSRDGYGQFWLRGRMLQAHRVSYELAKGPIPEGMLIDHVCHNPRCVNPSHLRVVTQKQNLENRAGAQRNSGSGVRGVSWHSQTQMWQAVVGHLGRRYNAGLHRTIPEAEVAVIALRNELYTHNDKDRTYSASVEEGAA